MTRGELRYRPSRDMIMITDVRVPLKFYNIDGHINRRQTAF